METHKADVFQEDEVLLRDILVYLEVTTSQAGARSWYGAFQHSSDLHLEPGGPYRLKLDDGRSGDILIRSITMSSHARPQVSFVGTGPLE